MGNITITERELFTTVIAVTLLFLLLSLVIILIMVILGKRRQKHLLELQALEYRYQENLMSSQIEIQENTLRHISQELHDNISQQLGLVKLQLTQMQMQGGDVGLTDTKTIVTRTIEDLRSLSHSLHPDRIASFSLKDNLLYELEGIKKLGTLEVQESIEPDAENLGNDKKVIVYRIVQELLNNCLKHANATQLQVSVSYSPNQLQLTLADNGHGISTEKQEGIGLISIKNRLNLLKGNLEMESLPGKGLKISIEVPL